MKVITTLSACLLLAGCGTNTVFVVQRDVPASPVFTVVPANDYMNQIDFANIVESYLLSAGAKVVQRPAWKEVKAEKQAAGLAAPSGIQVQGAQASMTEWFAAFDSTNADYFVLTFADTRYIRIMQRSTKEILASFELKKPAGGKLQEKDKGESDVVKRVLNALGARTN